MCWGTLSSAIRVNREGLPPLPRAYGDQFFADLRPFLPHLKWMNFLGGEPLLSAESFRIWDMMIEDGLRIPCHITTNGSQYNARVQRVLDALPVNFTLSLDGSTKETFENVRRKSNFETVITNLHRFHEYSRQRGTSFKLAFCLMRQNWQEFGDILLLGERLDCNVLLNTVISPSFCSLYTLPPHELKEIVTTMEEQGHALAPQLHRNRAVWEEALKKLRSVIEPAQTGSFATVMHSRMEIDDPLMNARRLAEKKDYAGALEQIQKVPSRHPDSYYALTFQAYLHGMRNDIVAAEQSLSAALAIAQKPPDAYLELARIRFKQGELDASLENARRANESGTPEDAGEARSLEILSLVHASRWRLLSAYRPLLRLVDLPASTREGEIRRDIASALPELFSNPEAFKARSVAFRVRALLWIAERSLQRRERQKSRAPSGITLSASPRPLPPILQSFTAEALMRTRWTLRAEGENKAHLVLSAEDPEMVRVAIEQAKSGIIYDIQLNCPHLRFEIGRVTHVAFRIRADEPRAVSFGAAQSNKPWQNLGLYQSIQATPEWRDVAVDFRPTADEENGRVHFDLGESAVPVEVASLTVGTARLNVQNSLFMGPLTAFMGLLGVC